MDILRSIEYITHPQNSICAALGPETSERPFKLADGSERHIIDDEGVRPECHQCGKDSIRSQAHQTLQTYVEAARSVFQVACLRERGQVQRVDAFFDGEGPSLTDARDKQNICIETRSQRTCDQQVSPEVTKTACVMRVESDP